MPHGKIIDADGHILEPVDLWQNYLEVRFKDRAIRMDTGDDGVEYLVVEVAIARSSAVCTRGQCGPAV